MININLLFLRKNTMDENTIVSNQGGGELVPNNNAAEEENKPVKCLNCGTVYNGRYCPHCGQSAGTGRFTLKFMFQNLLAAILSNDGGVLFTLKKLFCSPGQMVLDIINGKRKSYFSPFPMLFFTLGLYILVFSFTGSNNIVVDADNAVKVENPDAFADNETALINGTVTKLLTLFNNIWKYYLDNYTLVIILTIPIYVFAVRTCMGKRFRTKYNVGETCVAVVYSLVPVILYETVCSIAFAFSQPLFEQLDNLVFVVHVAFISLFFSKLTDYKRVSLVLRSALSLVLYNVAVVLIIVLLVIVIVATYYDEIRVLLRY